MTKESLIYEISKILGVSQSEKELAFEIFTSKLATTLSFQEAVKIRDTGVFQLRRNTSSDSNGYSNDFGEGVEEILVFTPMTESSFEQEEIDFIIIDFKKSVKRSLDFEEVFSPGFGKPIIPLTTDTDLTNNIDASYLLLKKSIEERVNEILSDAERLENFNLLDEHFRVKSLTKDQYQNTIIDELTSDMEELTNNVSQNLTEEDKSQIEPDLPDEPFEENEVEEEKVKDIPVAEMEDIIEDDDDLIRRAKLITEEEDFVRETDQEDSIEQEFGIKKIDDSIEEELIDWNWGDNLIDEYEPESEEENETEIEEEEDEFTTLANGFTEPTTTKEIFEKVMDEDLPPEKHVRTYDISKQGFIKNFAIIFAALLFFIIIILWLFSDDDKYVDLSADPNESAQVISKEESENVISQSTSDMTEDIPQEPETDPIVERTNKILGKAQASSGDLYRSFTSEQNVGGLVFYGGSYYYVQTSSWRESAKAEKEVRRLRSLGFDAFVVKAYIPKYNSNWYRVRIGNFSTKNEAETFLRNNKF